MHLDCPRNEQLLGIIYYRYYHKLEIQEYVLVAKETKLLQDEYADKILKWFPWSRKSAKS